MSRTTVHITARLPWEIVEWAEAAAKRAGRRRSDMFRLALELGIAEIKRTESEAISPDPPSSPAGYHRPETASGELEAPGRSGPRSNGRRRPQ